MTTLALVIRLGMGVPPGMPSSRLTPEGKLDAREWRSVTWGMTVLTS